jgi:DNA (cytosine-5)-methyltransferase 1
VVVTLTTVDLFAGIGGFARGLEATGDFRTTCFVEQDPYCQAVLRHHWPDVPILDDIKNARRSDFPDPRPDLVCGGFPCQPFSQAGKQLAQDDPRHLWPEMLRIIRELRPTWVVGENVVGLIKLGLDEVLTDLESEGYATRTFNIPACATGAPHLRQRIWVVAHADSESEPDKPFDGGPGSGQLGFEFVADPRRLATRPGKGMDGNKAKRSQGIFDATNSSEDVADPQRTGKGRRRVSGPGEDKREDGKGSPDQSGRSGEERYVADPDRKRGNGATGKHGSDRGKVVEGNGGPVADPDRSGQCEQRGSEPVQEEQSAFECTGSRNPGNRPEDHWRFEPDVGRLVDGLPNRVSQLRALGNSIVPQIAQEIGRAIKVAHDGDV